MKPNENNDLKSCQLCQHNDGNRLQYDRSPCRDCCNIADNAGTFAAWQPDAIAKELIFLRKIVNTMGKAVNLYKYKLIKKNDFG